MPLQWGTNLVQVRVTAQDGITIKTYTVTVRRSSMPHACRERPHSASATLNGVTTPFDYPATAWFEWGPPAAMAIAPLPLRFPPGRIEVCFAAH